MRLSAVVIALNEEKNIGGCLDALKFCDEVVVVDGGSADRTAEICKSRGAKLHTRPFGDFASQKNFAVSQAKADWVLLVDADERVTPELAVEIKEMLSAPKAEGYFFVRQNRIFGRWMAHGANRDDRHLRLVKREKAVFRGAVHERIYPDGATASLRSPLLHYSTSTVSDYLRKLNVYSSLEAGILSEKSSALSPGKMMARSAGVFGYRVFWQRGILDGLEGFIFYALSAYYEMVRFAKLWELSDGKTRA